MARPPLALGTPGSIKVAEESAGVWVARCRFRDHDGVTRRMAKFAGSKTAARTALHRAVEQRQRGATRAAGALSPTSTFADAAEIYLDKVKRKRQDTTYVEYKARLDNYVLPGLGSLRLRECSPARLDGFFEQLGLRYTANTRRNVRTVVSGVMQQAVLHDALDQNPVRELDRIEQVRGKRKASPRGLTLDERQRLFDWLDSSSPDPAVRRIQEVARRAELPELVRFFLGTGLRIGEGLAVRRLDVNLDGLPVGQGMPPVPVVTVTENLVWVKGKGLVRHDGKSDAALRIIPLPSFAVDIISARLELPGDPSWPLFPTTSASGDITYRWPANVRRTLRKVREQVGLEWMTPHTWRRTYATILDDELTLTDRMKADLMGHAKFLKNEYVSRGELHPSAAVVVQSALSAHR
ncbi:site-specific integrase [Actinomycetospora endophytica]|uniref:Site-specific integrase n=1 Tax=Actinomycetospora endophytica TaxID=2291215 RepID=A0ABS8PHF2_9PSEU|nr:site-specific integrase [Actinomycetospora endophytica]MCD2197699.1 site-specific integrase [Actinomycetospora endophytica]